MESDGVLVRSSTAGATRSTRTSSTRTPQDGAAQAQRGGVFHTILLPNDEEYTGTVNSSVRTDVAKAKKQFICSEWSCPPQWVGQ